MDFYLFSLLYIRNKISKYYVLIKIFKKIPLVIFDYDVLF